MNITHANFIKSSAEFKDCPESRLPEFAFIGRSNVGKSSLINMLCDRKDLAKTSSRPGKTQLINHFKIDENWFLVDLPGYGYAKVSKENKKTWQKMITDYLLNRPNLCCTFVLIDARHEPLANDLEFMEWMGVNQLPFAIIFTKMDKLNVKDKEINIERYKEALSETWEELPPYFISSSTKRTGKEKILAYIVGVMRDLE